MRGFRRSPVRTLVATGCALLALSCGADAQNQPAPANPRTGEPGTSASAPANPRTREPSASGARFDSARAWAHLEAQVALGPRPAGSPALTQTRRYLADQLNAVGLDAKEQPFTGATPKGPIPMINLIATIPGKRPERIVLATHYDTKLFTGFRFLGASDAASSTAVVLELARVLKMAPQEYTIELLFLDGEEAVVEWQGTDNTYGSRHYVDAARAAGTLSTLKALVLVDMVGDRDLDIRRDSNSSPWLVDIVWASAGRLGYRRHFPEDLTTIEDDHIPFVRAGIPSVDIIDLDYPAWHTAQDDLAHVSAESLQVVGDVLVDALPQIQQQLPNR